MKTISTLKKAFGILTCTAMFAASAQTQESGGHSSGSPAGFGTAPMAAGHRSPHKASDTNLFKGELYGTIVSSADWTVDDTHPGLYKINPDLTKDLLMENIYMNGSAAVYIRGKMYFATATFYSTVVTANALRVFDADNLCPIGGYIMPNQLTKIAVGYAYDRMSDKAYAITYNANGSGFILNSFDYDNRTYTPICSLNDTFLALTFTPDGTLYGIDNKGVVKTIGLTDGATVPVVNTGLTPQYVQSATWSPKDNAIIWTATLANGTGQIVKIDPTAKTSEKLCDFHNEVIGLYTNDIIAADGAPCQPEDMAISYNDPGSNLTTVSFTVPTKTVSGAAINGDVDVEIVVDGDFGAAIKQSAKAGSTFSKEIDLNSTGVHKIAVYAVNSEGRSMPAITNAFGGYDTPTQVEDLKYDLTKDGALTLSWSPSKPSNSGYIGSVTYHIERDGIEIASTSDTSFSETIGGGRKLYEYSVVPEANGIRGEKASTEKFAFGEAIDLPFSNDFSDSAAFLLFTPVDANEDGNTWKLSDWTKCAVYQRGDVKADDYLIAPPFMAEAHHTYSLSFDAWLDYRSNPEEIHVVVANGSSLPELRAGKTILDKESISNVAQEKKHIEVTFTADEDGLKYFAWHITSDASCWKLNISDVTIKDMGNVSSPGAATGLTVTPAGNGSLKATVAFSAPTVTVNGSPLTRIDRIELSRDGEFIRAFSNVTPGQKVEYEDEVDVPAFYTYSAVCINESGKGDVVSTREYVGGYEAPVTFLDDSQKSDFRYFSIIDDNEDGNTWEWDDNQKAARYIQDENGYAGDFLFSPMVRMEAGKVYEISYDAHVTEGSAGFVLFTKLSGTLSKDKISTFYPAEVVRSTGDFEKITKFIQVAETGSYSIVVESAAVMKAGEGVYIKNISVKEGPAPGTPAAVEDIKATPAANGELKATISFKLPSTNIMGATMGSDILLGAKVYDNNGDLCGEVPMQYHPNDSVKMEVKALQGINRFTVYATNEHGEGDFYWIQTFCGIDTPFRVHDLSSHPSADNMGTTLKWSVPTEGSHGGWFNPEELEYHVYMVDENGNKVHLAKTSGYEYSFNAYDNTLRKYTLGVIPASNAGMGTQINTRIVQLGTPLSIPFEETFADGRFSSEPWFTYSDMESSMWKPMASGNNVVSEDNGFLLFHDTNTYTLQSYLSLPKVSLAGIPDAKLQITIWQYYEAKSLLRVNVSTDDNQFDNIGDCFCEDSSEPGDTSWKKYTFDLSKYAGKWIHIMLHGILSDEHYAAIDDIRITSDFSGVEETVMDSGIMAIGTHNAIEVLGADGRLTSVYGADGRTVYNGIPTSDRLMIPVQKGIYVIIADGRRIGKVVVK